MDFEVDRTNIDEYESSEFPEVSPRKIDHLMRWKTTYESLESEFELPAVSEKPQLRDHIDILFTPSGLPVPPYEVPLKVSVDSSDIRKCKRASLDLGNPPIWVSKNGFQEVFVPSSSKDLIVAKASLAQINLNCELSYKTQEFYRRNYYIKDTPYQVEWVENCLETQVTQTELQDFCNEAFDYCRTEIAKGCFYYRVTKLALLVALLWCFLFGLLIFDLVFIVIPVTLVLGTFILMCLISPKVTHSSKKVHLKLAKYIHGYGEFLIQKGVKPRPGAFGFFIEFLPL